MEHDSAQYLAQHSGETSFAEYNSSINEIHHRFKNNLQVILSLFSLQADRTTNPQVREMLTEMQNRVRAIAYLHEPLYSTDNLSAISSRIAFVALYALVSLISLVAFYTRASGITFVTLQRFMLSAIGIEDLRLDQKLTDGV